MNISPLAAPEFGGCEEQIGKTAAEMVLPSYYISVTGDVIGDPAYTPVVHDQVVDLKLKLRS